MTGSEFQVAFVHFTTTTEYVLLIFGAVVALILFRLALAKYKINFLPESALIIILGIVVGLVAYLANVEQHELINFNYEIFFLIFIPPIILEAGYFLHKDFFFNNLRLIILFAVIGTFLNSFLTGAALYLFRSAYDIQGSFTEYLSFGALISAVDPVAVLAIFEEAHVNETLQILVSGESILNDSVAIVLYQLFVNLTKVDHVTASIPFLAIARFLLVSFGGLIFGVFMGLLGSWLTKFTKVLQLFEPILLMSLGFLSYQIAEVLSLSGIVSILFCGIIFSRYSDMNMTHRSTLTFKRDLKSFASMNEAIIFLYLGTETTFQFASKDSDLNFTHDLDAVFTILTLVFIFLFRFLLVVILTRIANRSRMHKVKMKEQFVLSYSGLRGAIAFALAFALPDSIESKNSFISTALIVVLFTVFIQGGTIKPIMKRLHLKFLKKENKKKCGSKMLTSTFDHLQHAIFSIIGGHGDSYSWSHKFHGIDKFIKKIMVRDLRAEEKEFLDLLEQLKESEMKEELNEKEKQRLLINQSKLEVMVKNPDISLERIIHEKKENPSKSFRNMIEKMIDTNKFNKNITKESGTSGTDTDDSSRIEDLQLSHGVKSNSSSDDLFSSEENFDSELVSYKKISKKRKNIDHENSTTDKSYSGLFYRLQSNYANKTSHKKNFSRVREPSHSFDKNVKVLPSIVGRGNRLKNIQLRSFVEHFQNKNKNAQRSPNYTNILSNTVSRHLLPQVRLNLKKGLNDEKLKIKNKHSSVNSPNTSSSSSSSSSSENLSKKSSEKLSEKLSEKSSEQSD
ncbi:sodium/hydrogen exchanger [Anaeramoeba flamelloides]|uniref:Sodium/hydrogen exchanger n=1 Tax=Anaeramoeba flamelloides TaxID=1746091 RepID=A0AAV8A6P5_9EUKA|nr:sodium/hydrogen exchanger [Anaeramoeba flamelloides]